MSAQIYDLKYKDITIGRFLDLDGHVEYSPVNTGKVTELRVYQRYPIGLYPMSIIIMGADAYSPTEDDIINWLQERVFPKERQNGLFILATLGLTEYDVWEIIKKTRALSDNDHYWITTDPNETYEEVRSSNLVQTIVGNSVLKPKSRKLSKLKSSTGSVTTHGVYGDIIKYHSNVPPRTKPKKSKSFQGLSKKTNTD